MTIYTDTQQGAKMIPSDRNDYWRYYGLHRDPFLPMVEDNNFFLPARWEQHVDLLQYLRESTNVLLSVTGIKGSGKTTFMRQFIAQASDNTKVLRLVGSAVLTAEQLSKTLLKDFSLPKPTGEIDDEYWEALCQSMQSSKLPYLLVIDDAHRLPQETLTILLNLIKQQSEHQMRLHILLVGEFQLSNMLNSLKESEGDRELIHTISLEPLNLQEMEAYIKHRLVSAGLPSGLPLRTTDLARIYKLSEGVPGRINVTVRQVLIDLMQQRQLYTFTQFIRTRHTQILGGIIILILLAVLAVFLTKGTQDPAFRLYKLFFSEKTITPNTDTMHSATTSSLETNKAVVMPTAIIDTTANNTRATEKQWYESSMVEFKPQTVSKQTNVAEKALALPTINKAAPIYQATTINPPSTKTTKASEIVKPVAVANKQLITAPTTTAQPNETTKPLIHKNAAPTEQQKISAVSKQLTLNSPLISNLNHYTLQLVGVSSESAVNKFIKQNQLENQAYYYHTNLRDKDLYAVVYGEYPNRSAAENALATLPTAVQEIHPLARTMKSVQESIQHSLGVQAKQIQPAATDVAKKQKLTAAIKAKGSAEQKQADVINIPQID